jgi:hypothetical protein
LPIPADIAQFRAAMARTGIVEKGKAFRCGLDGAKALATKVVCQNLGGGLAGIGQHDVICARVKYRCTWQAAVAEKAQSGKISFESAPGVAFLYTPAKRRSVFRALQPDLPSIRQLNGLDPRLAFSTQQFFDHVW